MKPNVPDSVAVVELRAAARDGNAAHVEPSLQPIDIAPSLIALQVEQSQFACVVLVAPSDESIARILSKEWPFPAVCISEVSANEHAGLLAKRAVRGFSLILGSLADPKVCIEQLARHGYTVDVDGEPATCLAHVLAASGRKRALADAFDLLPRLGVRTAICFAHDADPIYVVALDF